LLIYPERVTTLRTAGQPLHDTWSDGTPARSYLVLVEQFLGTGKAFFRHQGGHGDLDPLFAGALVACCGEAARTPAPSMNFRREKWENIFASLVQMFSGTDGATAYLVARLPNSVLASI
jgi:hypothetical protein